MGITLTGRTLFELPIYRLSKASYNRESLDGNWKYNDIIGYLQFYKWADDIRCAYYKGYDKKAIRNGKRLFYKVDDTLYKIMVKKSYSNEKLKINVKEIVDFCIKLKQFKTRFIDTSTFNVIVDCIDWKQYLFNSKL